LQTFLPYPCFVDSAAVLDNKRLGKQRVEVLQILTALREGTGWIHHPATKMWEGYEDALCLYGNTMILEWVSRGYKNTIELPLPSERLEFPPWKDDPRVHDSHKSNLLRKFPEYYSRYSWDVPHDLPYHWPV
jgi:hypothetical protein